MMTKAFTGTLVAVKNGVASVAVEINDSRGFDYSIQFVNVNRLTAEVK